MCGITGWIDFTRNIEHEREQVQRMASKISHRGPDETDFYLETHVGFGHQRLIVVDPAGGKQPMSHTKDQHSYVLVYNGELYNTEDIRSELLKQGWQFNSHSDTEVLLKSYIEWGEAHVEKLNGIFAYAIWDPSKQQLFLARDRLGVKPLFYKQHHNGLLFGSEIKAILAHDEVDPVIKEEGLSEIFALGPSRTPGHGVFGGLKELRAAHVGIFNRDGWKTRRYWNVESKPHEESVEETAEKVRHLLVDAVERQLVSDVPLGTFLSGGVDSSAITAIAAQYLENNQKDALQTFSIDYEDNDKYFKKSSFQPNQDKTYIEKMVQSLGTEHHNFVIDNATLVDLLKDAVRYRDLPGMADVDSSLLWFCEQTKKEVTVALSGECADEIFGGYPWFYLEDDLNREGFPWIRSSEVRQNLLRSDVSQQLNLAAYTKQRYEDTVKEAPLLDGEGAEAKARRQMFYLNMQWFMPTLLDRKDRMSMGASFEARVPFSDHHLVEYVWNIPWEIKTHGDREKGILRKALEGILPDEILYRKKSPYPKTHHPAYTNAVINWMNEIIDDKNARLFEILDRSKVKALVDQKAANISAPWFGQLMTGPQLLAHLAQIEYWLQENDVMIDI
ncbi:asparagine synthase (glutamine-hydrolyzing) [Gracilibacillus thailandensis]|uniref:asparagine synthase (glutamine-hydrolyzing) n=1 Tax=Gracilibacillus thailandensis TaxID=563735 RepID=A0A6N7QWG8_9BACI|nr:asparagine synthase (glutamine-hydrolyzing) [Gracilibacillus thailandensis]MRI65060.1 asparagine synthase (glutamine-hydrolyzing) [Gracilibacillus thailandensis]